MKNQHNEHPLQENQLSNKNLQMRVIDGYDRSAKVKICQKLLDLGI